jgi:hypothetical protein
MSEITPDDKDWTWVLDRPCPECGFEASTLAVEEVGPLVRASVPRWQERLRAADARVRPDPATWSPTEYAAHVRDVFRIFDVRLASMLESDDPSFANWDQDATALEDDYASQDPAVVARELDAAAEVIATRFDTVTEDQHARPGRRSNGSVFTVVTLGQYFAHDLVHHLHDVDA